MDKLCYDLITNTSWLNKYILCEEYLHQYRETQLFVD